MTRNRVHAMPRAALLLALGLLLPSGLAGAGGTYGSIRHASEGMFVDPLSQPYQQKVLSPSDSSLQHQQQRVNPLDRPADPSQVNVNPLDRPADSANLNVSPIDPSRQHRDVNVSPIDPSRQHQDVNVQPWHPKDNWFAREASGSPSRDTDKTQLWQPRSATQRYLQDTFMGGQERRPSPAEEAKRQQRVREPEEGRDYAVSTPETRASAWDKVQKTFVDQGADWHQARHADVPDPGQKVDGPPLGAEDLTVGGTAYKTSDGVFYQQQGGVWRSVYPPIGGVVAAPPMGYTTVRIGGDSLFYYQGAYYRMNQGTWDYAIIEPPLGAVVPYLPDGAEKSSQDGVTVYRWDAVIYQPVYQQGGLVYEVVGVH